MENTQRPKMSSQDLKDLYPTYDPSGHTPSRATNKGFKHVVGKSAKPSKGALSPAQWHRKQRGRPAPYNYK